MTIQTTLQTMKTTEIKTNQGILPIKLGNAHLQTTHWTYIHKIDLKPFKKEYDNLRHSFSALAVSFNKSKVGPQYATEFNNNILLIENLFGKLDGLLEQITPHTRRRRGLINALGSIVKAITGNLDQDDAQKYDELISKLLNSQDTLKFAMENQVSVMNNAISGFQKNVEIIKDNQKKIQFHLSQIESFVYDLKIKELQIYEYFLMYTLTNQFALTLQIMIDTLNNIQTAMSFSRIHTFHTGIIAPSLLIQEIKNTSNLIQPYCFPLEINNDNLSYLEKILKVKVYSKLNEVIFIYELPIVGCETYNYFKVFPIPSPDNLILITTLTYFLENAEKFVKEPKCQELGHSQFICEPAEEYGWSNNVPCEISTIRYRKPTERCHYAPVKVLKLLIEQVNTNTWILVSPNLAVGIQRCGNNEENLPFNGTYILEIHDKCSLRVDGKTLQGPIGSTADKQAIHFPKLINIDRPPSESIEVFQPLQLEEINTNHLQELRRRLQQTEKILRRSDNHPIYYHRTSVFTIVLYLILFCLLLYFGYRKWIDVKTRKPSGITTTLVEGTNVKLPGR